LALDSASIEALIPIPGAEASSVVLSLPTRDGAPTPSPHMAFSTGRTADKEGITLTPWNTPTIAVAAEGALAALESLESRFSFENAAPASVKVLLADSVWFYLLAARVARRLVAEQRVAPNALEDRAGSVQGVWRPWLNDETTIALVSDLLVSMPPAARAAVDALAHNGWTILQDFLASITDALCRSALSAQSFVDAVEDRDATADAHVAWLSGLLDHERTIAATSDMRSTLIRGVREWLSRLDERGADSQWRLCFRLLEPEGEDEAPDFGAPGRDVRWTIVFELQSAEHPETSAPAISLWSGPADATTIGGLHLESPHDLLLAELARASRLYPAIDRVMEKDPEPAMMSLTTTQAYDFLREIRPLLIEQGFGVATPEWWEAPASRLGVTLDLFGDEERAESTWDSSDSTSNQSRLGLDALVDYQWRLSLGDTPLTQEQFDELTTLGMPLVRVSGRWVELRPEDVKAARRFLDDHPGGSTSLGSALRLAFGVDAEEAGLHVRGVNAQGWAERLFSSNQEGDKFIPMPQPEGLKGLLRPYQLNGLAWLAFLDRIGLGACLADDMGLGKTVQLLALVLAERERLEPGQRVDPTLVVAPLSVISNWRHESDRFMPSLRVLVHHGPDRLVDDDFAKKVSEMDIVITTYALANRDVETLRRVHWRRIALDEAQNIKNPTAKQTQAILTIPSSRRIAITGTPVENRLSELWSLMNFCNEGYLGTLGEFRRRFALPIERRHSKGRAQQLRSLTRPFILRRLKTDPAIAADLPEKITNKVYSHLGAEQATLYEQAVKGMLTEVDRAEGMRRRGVVLATLIKLKQICNHPAQAMGEDLATEAALDPRRSGKCMRLIEMLDEVLAEDQQALIFTQFRQMGKLLAPMLRRHLDREVIFLHGGTTLAERKRMIERFQSADGSAPIFLLSLKAGGFGLNLTAASHVFHFDRWWNPAVENQATDRAHRIGQTRTVHVHKFVVAGTLEERIDQMIEDKSDLAERIIGSGERGLTELSTEGLRELLTLRAGAVDEEPMDPLDQGSTIESEEVGHGV